MRWRIAQWFEKRWWKRYLKNRSVEVYLQWKKDYWKNFLSSIGLNELGEGRKLDAGCGPAGIFIALEGEITACDPLLSTYATLPHFNPKNYANVTFQSTAIEQLAFERSFSYVFCLNVINHVEGIQASIDALAKSVADSGLLILSIDCHNWRFFKWLFRAIPMDILHPHQFDLADYITLVEKSGLKVQRTQKLSSGFFFDYYVLICEKP